MVQLVVAEKPSVARDLAKVLGARNKAEGCIQGQGYWITWCMGHMAELCEPASYNPSWKSWSAQQLPMLPEAFQVQPRSGVKKHWGVLRKLLRHKEVEQVINACDAGREGELIFRYVYEMAGCNKRVMRLWLSSLTEDAIRQGLQRMKPGSDFDPLADAARSRSEADWLVGMNSTRALTLLGRRARGGYSRDSLMSVGRVQTPTLAMIVEREREIVEFKPEPFWQVYATFGVEDGKYEGLWHKDKENRLDEEAKAKAIEAAIHGQTGKVGKVQQKKVQERPPLLYDLTQLQRAANQRFGFSAARTLEIAQALYEKHKLLTYPRTDSNYLTSDMKPKLPGVLKGISVGPWAPFCQTLLGKLPLKITNRIVNDKEVGDHHAIIPTGKAPRGEGLSVDEKRIFDMVARRFIAVFFPNAVFATTRIETLVQEHLFLTQGRVRKEAGWQEVDPPSVSQKNQKEEAAAALLPDVKKGDAAQVLEERVHQGMTKPPRRYNEASLLRSMELAGKELEDQELRRVMKDAGIGTPATRASVIETLLKRKYIQRQGRNLEPTPAGQALVNALPVDVLKSAQLTGAWEQRLTRMAEGNYPRSRFMEEVRSFTQRATRDILGAPVPEALRGQGDDPDGGDREVLGQCPVCQAAVTEGFKAYSCGSGRDCSFVIFKEMAGRKISPALVKLLLSGKTSKKLKGFRSKKGKTFEACIKLNEEGRTTFVFDNQGGGGGGGGGGGASPQSYSAGPPPMPEPPPPEDPRQVEAAASNRAPAQEGVGRETEPPAQAGRVSCPSCQEGHLVKGKRGWGCSRWREGCRFVVWFEQSGRVLRPGEARALFMQGEVGPLEGFEGGARGKLVLDLKAEGFVRLDPVAQEAPQEVQEAAQSA